MIGEELGSTAQQVKVVKNVPLAPLDRVREFGEGKDERYGTANAVIREAREAIADARTADADVSDLTSHIRRDSSTA